MSKAKPSKLKDAAPIPDVLRPSIEKARARTITRRHGPPVHLERGEDGKLHWSWPFGENDTERRDWKWLVLDAFGTRYESVAGAFLEHLIALCAGEWDEEHKEWLPHEGEVVAILHIVTAHRPRNEAEAALAAQIAATHIITMKVAERAARYPWDHKTVGSYAKLVQASAAQFETMLAIKGKRRSTSQKITVRHEKHVHHHQHVHLEGGASENASQPHAASAGRTRERPTLQGDDAGGQIVPLPSREGNASLQDARRHRVGRTNG